MQQLAPGVNRDGIGTGACVRPLLDRTLASPVTRHHEREEADMSDIERDHGTEVPVADAEEQQRSATSDDGDAPEVPAPTVEADAADVWEQRHEVPLDDDEPESE
jgi:hypothetical protein